MTLEVVQKDTHCEPNEPAPQAEHEMCEGKIMIECCCPRLQTRTFTLEIGPQTVQQMRGYANATVNNYENAGYVILSMMLVDSGAGWVFGFTVGWYA